MSLRLALFLLLAASVTSFTLRPHSLHAGRAPISQRLSGETTKNVATTSEDEVVSADGPEEVVEEVTITDVLESAGDVVDKEPEEESGGVGRTERHTIYIGNLPYSATTKDIREMVEEIAEVRYINVPKDRESDRIRGFAFVDVASAEEIPKVVDAINGLEMDGRRLRASRSLEKDQIRSTKREFEGSKKLYVGNLAYTCTKEHLSQYIQEFGEVNDVFIPLDNYGKSRGFAFIAVKDEDVEAVINGANGKEFMGRPIAVNHPLPPGEKSPKKKERPGRIKIYVGNLAFYTSSETVSEVFSEFGDIYDVYIPKDIESERSRGFGFVSMGLESGKAAIDALDGCELDGRIISVNEARPREEKDDQESAFEDENIL